MSFSFKPADQFTERAGLFIALTGGTNSGKTFSAMRLARGIAGPDGKIAVVDTEGGRTLHLKRDFGFDANVMDPPFRPERFAEAARAAEDGGYAALVIDSFSMEWVGLGGVLDWQAAELERMSGGDFRKAERMKMASWIKPKMAHKAMVYSLLQRRIPIVFSIRGEESVKPGEAGEKPTKIFKSVCSQSFPYEVTVSFRLSTEHKGIIDLSDPRSFKMEGSHRGMFRDGEQISERHGELLAAWARGETPGGSSSSTPGNTGASAADRDAVEPAVDASSLLAEGDMAAARGMDALGAFWKRLSPTEKHAVGGADQLTTWKTRAAVADNFPGDQ